MIKYFCDLCRRELDYGDRKEFLRSIRIEDINGIKMVKNIKVSVKIDGEESHFCHDCILKIIKDNMPPKKNK